MSDDFGTINARRGDRARELDVLRQHYRQHREALARMIADAPTEHLASEYQRLIVEIDRALGKLHELEGSTATAPPSPPVMPMADPAETPRHAAPNAEPPLRRSAELPMTEDAPRWRVPLIVTVAAIGLALIGWLIWRASSDRKQGTIVESTAETTAPVSTAADSAVEPPPAPVPTSTLAATPESQDYGVIRKGTRAVRQFEIANNSDEPVPIAVARSACRCLYYEHVPVIPPRAKETLTVTVDAAKAKAGELRESVKVSKKNDPETVATVEVQATVQ